MANNQSGPEYPNGDSHTLQPDTRLSGKAALITGAARRVGAAIARSLHAAGANVILHYRSSAEDAAELAQELNKARAGSATLVSADLLEIGELPALARTA